MRNLKKFRGLLAASAASLALGTCLLAGCNKYDAVSVAVVRGADHESGAAQTAQETRDAGSLKNGGTAESEIGAHTEMNAGEETTMARIELATEAAPETTAAESAAEIEHETVSPEDEECVLLFAGDVYLSDHVLNAYDKAGGIHGVLDNGIRAEIEAADIFMVNMEFPFTERGTKAEDKQYTFRLPHDRLHIMNEMGIDIVTMANNHILDFGPEGITDSIAALNEAGIKYVGVGENLEEAKKLEIIEIGGRKIGFLGTSRVYMAADWAAGTNHPGVFSTYDPTLPIEEIKKADELVDYLVVYVHWGVERETIPKDYQRTMGKLYIDAGADAVIGSHPHVLQPLEYYDGKPIMYSLGNFVFGSSIPSTEMLKITLGADDSVTVEEIPCTSSGGYTRLK